MLVLRRSLQRFAQPRYQRVIRQQSTYQPPDLPKKPNAHGNFYKEFGRPVAKCFLIAVATYQLLYISWIKLESFETKQEKGDEIKQLEGEIRALTQGQSS